MYKKVSEIRKSYIEYFKSKGHSIVPSSSLIPVGDPTLLFTTAGMVQFKPYFTAAVELPFTRAASSQKCLRTTDLENVGRTERHCTFFEMLGNFSFGDYFKKEAIEYALDFSTNYLKFPIDKIWITVYQDDDEAENMWIAQGIPKERIVRLGKADNFWGPAGETGACGPCSELYLDRGPEKGGPDCGKTKKCEPGCDCDRFLEFWNLVFNQFDQDAQGKLNPLKQTGIDTGSGLERVALLLQGVDSVYDTDELKRIIQFIEKLSGRVYNSETKVSFRVLTDHARAVTFAITDGVRPDKTGRGYVIRRLIRRASLFSRKLGITSAFIYKIVNEIVAIYKEEYPELAKRQSEVETIIKSEEELFLNTLELGISLFENILKDYKSSGEKLFRGTDIFKLYSTYGFPPEMTKELILDSGMQFDKEGFEAELEKDRALSRESWKGKKAQILNSTGLVLSPTEFSGYDTLDDSGKIVAIIADNKSVSSLNSGQSGVIVLNKTSFYGESGGQIGDTGYIKKGDSIFQVQDTQKENDVTLHIGFVLKGSFRTDEEVNTEVERDRRRLLTYHHSATHLMNGALRQILGTHVSQKASLVSHEYLRFDFSHNAQMTEEEILKVESRVNEAIAGKVAINTQVLPIEEAKKTGAVAFFDEKYGNNVRVVKMSDYSTEFCGGTHVKNTSDIQYFYILKESSPGAGNRRIEAVCGDAVVDYFQLEFQGLTQKAQEFNLKIKEVLKDTSNFIESKIPTPEELQEVFKKDGSNSIKIFRELKRKIEKEMEDKQQILNKEKKKLASEENANILNQAESLTENAQTIGDISFVSKNFTDCKIDLLKELGDRIKNRNSKIAIAFTIETSFNISVLVMANKQAVSAGIDCSKILKTVLVSIEGKGGGKPDTAQGAGKPLKSSEELINLVKNELIKIIGGA